MKRQSYITRRSAVAAQVAAAWAWRELQSVLNEPPLIAADDATRYAQGWRERAEMWRAKRLQSVIDLQNAISKIYADARWLADAGDAQ